MESGEEGLEMVFDAFRGGGFVELLGAGDFAGVGEVLGMEEGDVEELKVPVVEREGVEMGGFLLRYDPACAPPRSSSPSRSSYRMMCFGGDEGFPNDGNTKGFSRKSSESCSSTSSSSSNSGISKPKKKTEQMRDRSSAEERSRTVTATSTKATRRASAATKKPRKEPQQPPSSQRRTSKVRKEKLGERITALQQLVSPFGKTDTASVLHEALGYVRFLQDQVQVLSSPYLQQLPSSARLPHGDVVREEEEPRLDLRSRGLCLVPLACTAQVAASNGADFWSPAMGSGGDHHQHAFSKH